MSFDQGILEAALIGLELKKARLEEQIASIKTMLGGKTVGRPRKAAVESDEPVAEKKAKKTGKKGKRSLSPEARERIAAAQKKRWAAHRGETV